MRGIFNINGIDVPNSVVAQGEETFLKMIFQNDTTVIAGGGNFYIGLCGELLISNSTVLADLTEPSTGGYTRQVVTRNATGWPSIVATADGFKAVSDTVTFLASGADYDIEISRAFLASTADNTGKLLAISGPLATKKLMVNGTSWTVFYQSFLR